MPQNMPWWKDETVLQVGSALLCECITQQHVQL
jgi:hypothetical protein